MANCSAIRPPRRSSSSAWPRCSAIRGWCMPRRRWPARAQVLDYLVRYTHRVAVSNERIAAVEAGDVRLRVRDNERGGTTTVRIDGVEFIRRFLCHVVPRGLKRVRHYGLLAVGAQGQAAGPGARRTGVAAAQRGSVRAAAGRSTAALKAAEAARCPHCKTGRWFTVVTLPKVDEAARPGDASGTPLAARIGCRGRHDRLGHSQQPQPRLRRCRHGGGISLVLCATPPHPQATAPMRCGAGWGGGRGARKARLVRGGPGWVVCLRRPGGKERAETYTALVPPAACLHRAAVQFNPVYQPTFTSGAFAWRWRGG